MFVAGSSEGAVFKYNLNGIATLTDTGNKQKPKRKQQSTTSEETKGRRADARRT
jgi:hypothetical protein